MEPRLLELTEKKRDKDKGILHLAEYFIYVIVRFQAKEELLDKKAGNKEASDNK